MPHNRKRFSQKPTDAASVPAKQRVRDLFTGDRPAVQQADVPGVLPAGPSRVLSLIDDDGKLNTAGAGQTGVTRLELDTGIDSPGLRFWKDATKTIELDAKTGDAFFKGTITGGSARFDDSVANATYVWIADLDGLKWKRQSDDKVVSFLAGGYGGPTTDDVATTAELRAVEISGGSDGAAQTREAVILIANRRRRSDPGNSVVAWNSAEINLFTRWNAATPLSTISLKSVSSTVALITMSAEQFFLQADPSPNTVGNSKYSAGTRAYEENSSNVNFTTTQTDIVSTFSITTIAGRRYKITCGWPRMLSTVDGDIVSMRIAEAGVAVLKEYRFRVSTTTAADGATISAVITPSAGSHTYKLAGVRQSGTGTITVAGNGGGGEQWILVEDIGHT